MTSGRLIAVVGPSGVGKDSVMNGIVEVCPHVHRVRRVITRADHLGGEDYEAVTAAEFALREAKGDFCLSWQAHGLQYGIKDDTLNKVLDGGQCMANLSRNVLTAANKIFPNLTVLNLSAKPQTLAARLTQRSRETQADILRRLKQAAKPLPPGLRVINLNNDNKLSNVVKASIDALSLEEQ